MNVCLRKKQLLSPPTVSVFRATVSACICLFVYVYIHEMSVSNVCNVLQGIICILYACLWCEAKKACLQRFALARGEFILIRSAALSTGAGDKNLK